MEVMVTIVSKLVYFTYLGDVFTTCLYKGYNPFTKYHGHPSIVNIGKLNQRVECLDQICWKYEFV